MCESGKEFMNSSSRPLTISNEYCFFHLCIAREKMAAEVIPSVSKWEIIFIGFSFDKALIFSIADFISSNILPLF